MNSTPLWCKVLRKTLCNSGWKWNQHEFGMKSTPIWSQLLYKALCNSGRKISMKQHEFSMNSTPIWFYQAFLVMINYKLSSKNVSILRFLTFQNYDNMNWKNEKTHSKRRPCYQLHTTNPNRQFCLSCIYIYIFFNIYVFINVYIVNIIHVLWGHIKCGLIFLMCI